MNKNYRVARSKALKDVKVEVVPSDVFYRWSEASKKKGGQVKTSRVMKEEEFAEWEAFARQTPCVSYGIDSVSMLTKLFGRHVQTLHPLLIRHRNIHTWLSTKFLVLMILSPRPCLRAYRSARRSAFFKNLSDSQYWAPKPTIASPLRSL